MTGEPPDFFDDASTLARPRLEPTPLPEGAFAVSVVEGPDVGIRFSFDGTQPSRVLVGKGPACEVRLTDREVSRRHLALELVGRRMRVTDLDSTNGTFIDGLGVAEGFVVGGESIRIGSTLLA